jgi:hypothetical protein
MALKRTSSAAAIASDPSVLELISVSYPATVVTGTQSRNSDGRPQDALPGIDTSEQQRGHHHLVL